MVFEKDKLHYSQYGSLKHENLIRCELSTDEVSLKRAMMDNLELDDPSLFPATKRLKIMMSDKDARSTDVLYQAESNREGKGSIEKATAENRFLTIVKTQVINSKSCFLLRDLLVEINGIYEKYGCEVTIARTKDLKKLITETFPGEIRFTPALRLHGSPLILHTSDMNPLWRINQQW